MVKDKVPINNLWCGGVGANHAAKGVRGAPMAEPHRQSGGLVEAPYLPSP